MLEAFFGDDVLELVQLLVAFGEIQDFNEAFLDKDLDEVIGLAKGDFELVGQLKGRLVDPASELAAVVQANSNSGQQPSGTTVPAADELPKIPKTLGLRLEAPTQRQ